MKHRLKIISAERAIHIVDALLLHFSEIEDETQLPETVQTLLHELNMVAHTCSRPSCEDTHQHWIPDIRKMEKELINNGFCMPLNQRGWKARIQRHKKNSKGI